MSGSYAHLESRIPAIIVDLPLSLAEAAEAGADEIAETAKGKVPVDSGDLRDAIHVEKVKKGVYAVVAGDEDAFYGHMVEHGTTHSAPHPFLLPSVEEDGPDVVALAQAAVRAAS